MTITMDAAGRLVLPKPVRDRARLAPGMPIEVRVVDGRVELESACAKVAVEKRGGIWVAMPRDKVPTLRQRQVEATLEALRAHGGEAAGDED